MDSLGKETKSRMPLKEAEEIAGAYGRFIGYASTRFKTIFFTTMPESLLPYPVERIKEALSVFSKHCHDVGDTGMLEAIRTTALSLPEFVDDEEALKTAAERLGEQKWYETSLNIIRDFRSTPEQTDYIQRSFKDKDVKDVDFANQDLPTAHKIVKIYATFLQNAQMQLGFIFSDKIPESLLPFPKDVLAQACEVYSKTYASIGHDENAGIYEFGKRLLGEAYVDDEVALKELAENLAGKEARETIISEMKEFRSKNHVA